MFISTYIYIHIYIIFIIYLLSLQRFGRNRNITRGEINVLLLVYIY